MTAYLVSVQLRHDPAAPQLLYLLSGDLDPVVVQRFSSELLSDSVTHTANWYALPDVADEPIAPDTRWVEVAYKPGVTDNEAESVRVGAAHMGIHGLEAVKTLRRHRLRDNADVAAQVATLHNPLVQTVLTLPATGAERQVFYEMLLRPPADSQPQVAHVPLLEADDAMLLEISRSGILSLDLAEMQAIQAYFRQEERNPTDGELETIAQTWSEHCSHKTFKARVAYRRQGAEDTKQELAADSQQVAHEPAPSRYAAFHMLQQDCEIDSLIKTFLMSATEIVRERAYNQVAAGLNPDWVLSAFVDNAGIVAFGPDHEVSIKVETHNHPSALEPFGGANTGVGGVVRDVLGVSAQPIANTDVLCFGLLDTPADTLLPGVLHPRTVASGVVAGVRDYGNKLGIPTVNGAVLYDPGYTANPLVFCGTVGLAPRGRHPRNVRPGDAVVVLGGRTGRDGIHGATFSSVELTHTTAQDVGSAVQIGDPITEKKMIDVLLQARDAGLYSAITDCGAGGLSAVGEMGAETGAEVALEQVPLKYAGLQPWEIWLSEAQERMVIAVPPQHLDALLALCASEDVEASVIGRFTDDGRLRVMHHDIVVVDLSMYFLHKGLPQRVLDAVWLTNDERRTTNDESSHDQALVIRPSSLVEVLKALLSHPNIASKESIIRTYDHEVGGRTVVKPLVGVQHDGPGDAAVLQPLRTSAQGLALGCGINSRYGEIDPYWMALACVDEALRNIVAVGGDPRQTAILDNFCWGDPRQPDRMAGLVRAAAGCYDAALAFGTPFVSGKDSLNNEYRDASGQRHAIPPTLLITALAIVPDVRQAVTMDLKEPGNLLYLVGETRAELGGSHYASMQQAASSTQHAAAPMVDLNIAPRIMAAMHQSIRAGLVRSCHDLSEGGLAVALAEMAFAGGHGVRLDVQAVPHASADDDAVLLFAESPSRFLAEIRPVDATFFAELFDGLPCACVGHITTDRQMQVYGLQGSLVLDASIDELKAVWQTAAQP